MKKNLLVLSFLTCMVIITLLSCAKEKSNVNAEASVDQIVVRMYDEPYSLSPILAKTSLAREVHQYIFLNLADYDYQSLELKPVLIESIPKGQLVESGPLAGSTAFRMTIRPEAEWSAGMPVTGYDVLWTYKIVNHPGIEAPAWKVALKDILAVEVDEKNPKNFVVYVAGDYFLSREIIFSAEIYPKFHIDPNNVLKDYSLADLKNEELSENFMKNQEFNALGTNFSSADARRINVKGAGPYTIESWETGQYIVLKQKENYWGEKIRGIDQLKSVPDRMVLQFLEDNATAVTMLKNEEIDVIDLTRATFKQFDDLKSDPIFSQKYNFETTQLPRYYYLMMNNEDVRLRDLEVRKALAHAVDVDRMINQIEGGYARRVNSFIHFTKPEYNADLSFIEYNPELAVEILEKAGWRDTDGDQIRDKVINGRKENLSLRFHISGTNLSSSVSSIVKEGCEEIGIDIEIIKKPNSATRSENLIPGDYELFITQKTQSPAKDDPHSSFHTNSIGIGGQNYMRFSNERSDELINTIRETKDEDARTKAYNELQVLLNETLPVVNLYSPQLRIVVNKKYNPVISAKRPGFFVNATKESE